MTRIFPRANLVVLACAATIHAFDAAYHTARAFRVAVPADSLIHYNMLLSWWRNGDSPRGFTLTPSPYFVDIVLQLPLALVARDFEQFSYMLAFTYATLIFAALCGVVRIMLGADRVVAVTVASISVIAFYSLAPFNLVLHAFIYNHTSELFSTLGMLALLHGLYHPGAPRRRYAPVVYALAVAACVVSSPFFIATYCLPAAFGIAAIVGTEYVSARRFTWFLGLTGAGAVAGLFTLALVAGYVWPIRNDHYSQTAWQAFKGFKHTLYAEPRLWHLSWVIVIGAAGSTVLAVLARRTRALSAPARFMLAYFPATILGCVVLPIKRAALYDTYGLRYVQLPWLLGCVVLVAATAWIIRAILVKRQNGRDPALRPAVAWSTGVLGVAGIALIATARGPLTISGPASTTSSMLQCFDDAERAGLEDGIATVWMARYMNAARLGSDHNSSRVVVEIEPFFQPTIAAQENNLRWFDGSYRGGRAKLNFLVTHWLGDDVLESWRARLSAPDRTISCPAPVDLRPDGKPRFELWIWDREDAQQKLAEMVTHDNLRSPFSPLIGATSMVVDVTWGMETAPHDGDLIDGRGAPGQSAGARRVWRRGVHRDGGTLAITRPMYLPGGRYRLELDLSTVASGAGPEPVAEVVAETVWVDRVDRFLIAEGTRHAVLELEVNNSGGATSGNFIRISVNARGGELIELSGMKLTLVHQTAIDPFRAFR